MSQYLFEENIKKSRKKALWITILLHVVLICGVWYASLSEESQLKTNMNQWMKNTSEAPAKTEHNVRP